MEAKSVAHPATGNDEFYVDIEQYGVAERSAWIDVDWSQYVRKVEIDGASVTYIEYGDASAPAILMIHGLGGSWQNWLENILQLGEDFRVIAMDLPGFGASEMPREPISIDGYARCVIGLLDELGIERASLIGNSMGGQTSVQVSIDHPERVDRVIVVSPAGYTTSDTPEITRRFLELVSPIMPRLGVHNRFVVTHPKLRKLAFLGIVAHGDKLTPEIAWEMLGPTRNPGFVSALQALLVHDFRGELHTITAPTLIIWGRDDGLISSSDAHRFGEAIPGSLKLIANDTSHVAMIERPAWFNETAREFLLDS
jgi:pimeloyl-ACP methyl ester carboxylesterase